MSEIEAFTKVDLHPDQVTFKLYTSREAKGEMQS